MYEGRPRSRQRGVRRWTGEERLTLALHLHPDRNCLKVCTVVRLRRAERVYEGTLEMALALALINMTLVQYTSAGKRSPAESITHAQ